MFKNNSQIRTLVNEPTLFDMTLDGLVTDFCVYEVWQGKELIYIGCCKLAMITVMPDAQQNNAFIARVPRDANITVRLIAIGERRACHNHRATLARQLNPVPLCNRHGAITRGGQIQCIEDGKIYPTQAAAAAAYGLHQGNISNHLRGRSGFNSVGGRTFRRIKH